MFTILPMILGIILYLLNEKNLILLLSNISLILIYFNALNIHDSSILIILILIFLISIWMILNTENISIVGSIFIIGSIISITSTSIISLFIGIEIISMTATVVINLYINDKYPGIIYYLFSGLISCLFILSIGYISIGYSIFNKLLYIVFIYKIGLFPFHILLPSIYNNLSPNVLLIIDIPYKILLLYILYRLNLFSDFNWYLLAICNIIISSIGILYSKNLFVIMIYSSIYNYILIFMSIIYQQIDYFIYYIFIYSLTTIIFLFLITHKYINFQIKNKYYLFFWGSLIFNLIGIPPLNGFFIKFFIFYITILESSTLLLILFLIGILFTTYTYLRIFISLILNTSELTIQNNNNIYKTHFYSTILTLSLIPLII